MSVQLSSSKSTLSSSSLSSQQTLHLHLLPVCFCPTNRTLNCPSRSVAFPTSYTSPKVFSVLTWVTCVARFTVSLRSRRTRHHFQNLFTPKKNYLHFFSFENAEEEDILFKHTQLSKLERFLVNWRGSCLWVCANMCVRVRVCEWESVYVWESVCVCVWGSVCVHVRVCARMWECLYVWERERDRQCVCCVWKSVCVCVWLVCVNVLFPLLEIRASAGGKYGKSEQIQFQIILVTKLWNSFKSLRLKAIIVCTHYARTHTHARARKPNHVGGEVKKT